MNEELTVDLDAIVRRVVSTLRPSADARADLLQEGTRIGLDLIRRFEPRSDSEAVDVTIQLERYLFVSLRWTLRAYARALRSSVAVPERDRRLVRDYHALIAKAGPLTVDEAGRQLGVRSGRLASALAGSTRVISLDQPASSQNDHGAALSEGMPSADSSPEQAMVTDIEAGHARVRQDVVRRAVLDGGALSTGSRAKKRRQIIGLFLDQLSDVDAELIRLSYGLGRKEVGGLPSCRAYGCRMSAKHHHPPEEIARWIEGEATRVTRRLADALDQLSDLLGGRDPRRLLEDASVATSAMAPPG